ncbi:ParB/RepB/Spo0J family partition protein [Paenibacillus endoradicis]|uniref:ParB/RepB/Spo0J family partition protein n=1 Tax=Paenibacillus endoradicis TaxID=2972487 RepID=UPI00215942CD|nr:ParB/RepB/Spo0J family partition protein [Paenibacillus endoradicis]MCR8660022.1 ParB/RepB/Spo0J family partition protein [Paenibacillus endoradicis]
MDITLIPISLIDEDKDQPRYQFSQEALAELANSISEIGLLSPIKVRTVENGRYMIIYGNRRYKASLMVGLESIPCIVSTATDEMDIYFEQIAENLTREDFSPIEEAEAFHKLMNDARFHSSMKLLSSKLGKPESYIKNKCELLKFGNAVKKLIVGGTQIRKDCLTEDQLMPLKDLPFEYRDTIALTAARDELPVSDVKKIAKLFKDQTISDATKEKLLLKNGRGLIETWSVFEQNRKEKLAREKERQEKAEQEELRKAEMIQQPLSTYQDGTTDVSTATVPNTYHVDEASIVNHSTQYATSTHAASIIAVHLDPTSFTDSLDELLEQADILLTQITTGDMQNLEATSQLSNVMLMKLQLLSQQWKLIQQKSNE